MRKFSAFLFLAPALLAGCGEEPGVIEPEDDPAPSGNTEVDLVTSG